MSDDKTSIEQKNICKSASHPSRLPVDKTSALQRFSYSGIDVETAICRIALEILTIMPIDDIRELVWAMETAMIPANHRVGHIQ